MYARNEHEILPDSEIDPDLVRHAGRIARALVNNDYQFAKGSGYALSTVNSFLRASTDGSPRFRSDLLRYSRAIAQEQRNTFFSLAKVEPIDLPETVFPYRINARTVEVPPGFLPNTRNPYVGSDSLDYYLRNMLYLSVRPSNSVYIHLYGRDVLEVKARIDQSDHAKWLTQLVDGPQGAINRRSTIANPTLLDYFANVVNLRWNVWGNSLRQGQGDLDAGAK